MGSSSSKDDHFTPPEAIGDRATPEYWRQKGDALVKARNDAFAASKAAWRTGDRALAGRLSQHGKELGAQAEQAHARAADMYLRKNNVHRPADELDLHGLKVKEAVAEVERALDRARAAKQTKVVLIVGRGLHSKDGIPKLRPAIESLVRKHNLRVTPGVPNAGCITVELVTKEERGLFGWFVDHVCVIC